MSSGYGYDESGPTSIKQVAAILGVSISTLYSWRKQGCPIYGGLAAIRAWRRKKPILHDPRGPFRGLKALGRRR